MHLASPAEMEVVRPVQGVYRRLVWQRSVGRRDFVLGTAVNAPLQDVNGQHFEVID